MKSAFLKVLLAIWIVSAPFFMGAQDAYMKRYYVPSSISYTDQAIEPSSFESKEGKREKPEHLPLKVLPAKGSEFREYPVQKADYSAMNIEGRLKANILFEHDTIFVNPWLIKQTGGSYYSRDEVYYFKLENRQSVMLPYGQWSLTGLAVPLKVRFGSENEFTTGANLGSLIGWTWGKTTFVHRKKIGNRSYDRKWTLGLFLGADKLEFSFADEVGQDHTVNTALLSFGPGFLFSYERFTAGLVGGLDAGLGENRQEWNYHWHPWAGAAIGYNLFSF